MTLERFSYYLLELLRQGHLVDDDRMDIRLIEDFIVVKRADYLRSIIDRNWGISENVKQYLEFTLEQVSDGKSNILSTVENVPTLLNTRFGLSFSNLSGNDTTSYMFSYAIPNRFRKSVGSGKFSGNIVYYTYLNDKILLKSKNDLFRLISGIKVDAVLEDPRKASDYDVKIDRFPIDEDGIEYIKNAITGEDFRVFLSGVEDEVSDGSGEIIK